MDWKKILGTGGGALAAGPLGAFLGYKGAGGDDFGGDLEKGLNVLSGKAGMDTAAAGAREAQAQAQALSQLQWQRQMAGLQEARGQTQPYLSLYDKIYGTQMAGHQTPVTGMNPNMMGGPPGAGGAGVTSPPPYNQGAAPRMVAPGQFLPASRVAGDKALQDRIGGNSLPGGPAYAGLPNGNAANPYVAGGSQTMATNSTLQDYLRSLGAVR